jgi:hypothetical protein
MDASIASRPDATAQQFLAPLQAQQPLLMDGKGKKIMRHKFTPEEDEFLRSLVNQLGMCDWIAIAWHFQGRTARECRDRWKHYLSPDVLVGNWTEADDQLLLAKIAEIGPRWAAIKQLFPGRTDIGLKNHYISITTRRNKEAKHRAVIGQRDAEEMRPNERIRLFRSYLVIY